MRLLSIIGARPQFVKSAVFRKSCADFGIDEVLLHTGQHYDQLMSLGIFQELNVKPPDICYTLSARSQGGMTGELIAKIEQTILDVKPDLVNLYGDTNTTLAGALAASKLHVPISHIEAGLRSFNKQMPEEVNRILTDHVSTYLFCPTEQSVKHLLNENIKQGVYHVGDIMFDAIKMFAANFRTPKGIDFSRYKKVAVLTIHRAETVTNLKVLIEIIEYCKNYSSNYQIIFPAHPNTRKILGEYSIELGAIELVEPLSYLEMQGLLSIADLVLTDSGGLQKEAYFHRCECVTLRSETEWLETIESGWNRLWIGETEYKKRVNIDDYGNGNACGSILKILGEL